MSDHDARRRALALLQAHGHEPTSFQILEEGFRYWFTDDAVVAYVEAAGHRVVAGAPVAEPDRRLEVAHAFVRDAHPLKVAFFGVEPGFAAALDDADSVRIGLRPDWVPAAYHTRGGDRASLRQQVNRARNKGVRVRRVEPEELARAPGPLRAEIEGVLDRWLASRKMSQMRFMVDLQPFTFPEQRRYYVAEQDTRAVGFLAAIPVYGRDGWFFEDVIRVPDAPNGTAELLIDTAMNHAREAGDAYVTLGLAPLAGVETAPGPHRWLRRGLRACYDRLGPLYHFAGVYAFKRRFRPDAWTPQHLVVTPGPVGAGTFHAVLRAFAGGGLYSFALETVARLLGRISPRAWAWLLRTLGLLLVPWTLLLANADARWFGGASIQWAWVWFDAAMVGALLGLGELVARSHRLARPLALLMAGATGADLLLSTVQAFHLHRAVTGWAAAFVSAGLMGPALATAVLLTLAQVVPTRPERRR